MMMALRTLVHLWFVLTLICGLNDAIAADTDPTLAVIVSEHPSAKVSSSADLTLIFLRKKLYWSDGSRIEPINLPTDHPLRHAFSLRVLGSLPEYQTAYWNEMYFHGITPPHVVNSTEAVMRLVEESDHAIGYVDACKVDHRVKVLLWVMPSGDVTNVSPVLDCATKPH